MPKASSKTTVEHHPGEPLAVIRGCDPFAVHVLIEYARRLERVGAASTLPDKIFDQAMKIAEWQRENPELVTDVYE